MANQIRYQVELNVNKSGLNQIKSSLQELQKIKLDDIMKINKTDMNSARDALKSIQEDASKVESALNKAFNTKLNTLNIDKFNKQLSSSNLTIQKVYQSFSHAGTAGQNAFNNLTNQILNTNLKLRQSNKLLDSMATSMANTVKWGITSSVFNNITRSIQQAYFYAKDLDRSLTDIRIVTGDSADQMQRFATTANNAAKDLGRSTLDYTKASLTFYQQGLDDQQVAARTEATLKAQNITGIGTEMADYLTAVWNGFNVGAEEAEGYVDKLAAVADSTASDMGQLATAMSKVASAANSIGVDMDQLNGQIATVIATTRQAPESVGAAFKTIYARINDIQAGTEDAEVSLGNYSGKMAALGVNVLDATGHLRDTGEVIEEIGGKWQNLTRQQQINLAQTMAGQRQYNNLIALFDNWDKYLQSVNTSMNAQGTLNEKNDRYLESLEAHMQQLGTQAQRTYDILFDTDTVKGFADLLDGILTKFNDFISMFGSGAGALTNLGLVAANVFNKQITGAIDKTISTIQTKITNIQNIKAVNQDLNKINNLPRGESDTYSEQVRNNGQRQALEIKKQILQISNSLTQSEYQELESLKNKIQEERTLVDTIEHRQQIAEEVLSIADATDKQILSEIQQRQKSLDLQRQGLTYLDDILTKNGQNVDGHQAVFQLEEKQLEKVRAIIGEKSKEEEYEEIIKKLGEGRALSEEETKLLMKAATDELDEQSKKMVTIQQLKKATLAVQRGEYESIQAALAADRQRTAEIEKQAQRRQFINALVSKGTALAQATQAVMAGIQQATDETATGAERVNGYWSATTSALSGVANFLMPGSGLLVQGVSSIIQTLFKGTNIYKSWEESLKSVEQRLNDLKKQQEQAMKISTDYTADKTKIQNISEEFEELSAKAGKYNQTLSNMTAEQQARYHELVNDIIAINPDLVTGYNSQGEAIIANNDAIQGTLDLLDKQYQKEMAIVYAKENVANAEKILKEKAEKDDVAQSKKANIYDRDEDVVGNMLASAQEQGKAKAKSLLDQTDTASIRDEITGETITHQTVTNYGNLKEVLNKLKDTDYEWIVNDFERYAAEYSKIVNDSNSSIEQIEQARKALYQNLSGLQNQMQNLNFEDIIDDMSWFGPQEGFIRSSEAKDIHDYFDSFLIDVDALESGITQAEEAVKKGIADVNSKADETSQQLQTALTSYKSYLFGSLRYDPSYNTTFTDIRNEWGENFTPQIQSLLESIMQDWVNTTLDTKYSTYAQEENMTAAVVKDFNTFMAESFEKIDQNDLISVNDQITDLLEKSASGEINAKEYEAKINEILQEFLKTDSFQKIFEEDTSENHQNSINLLQALLGININSLSQAGDQIVAQVDSQYNKMTSNITSHASNQAIKDAISGLLNESNYSKQELSALSAEIEKDGIVFTSVSQYLKYIEDFFGKGADAAEENSSKILEGFDKVSNAIDKIQNGKDLTYKDKLNLMKYLGLTEEDVQDAETILAKFRQQIAKLTGLQRYEGLQKIFTDFDTLKQYKDDFNLSDEQRTALWQDIFDKQAEAIGMQQDQLRQWAINRGMILESAELDEDDWEEILGTAKMMQQAEGLKDLAEKFVDENGKIKKDIDTTSQDFLKLQTAINELTGQNYDASTIKTMIEGIVAWTDDGSQSAEQYLEWLKQLFNFKTEDLPTNITAGERYKEDKTSVDNLEGASKSLTDRSTMSQDQSAALGEILAIDQNLAKIAEQQGINSKDFLEALNTIIEAKKQELQIDKQAALAENERDIKTAEMIKKSAEIRGHTDKVVEQEQKLNELYAERAQLMQQTEAPEYDADINVQELQNLSDTIQQIAVDSEELDESLATNEDAADDLAQAILRFDDACKDVADNYEDWMDALNSGSIQEQAQAMDGLRDAYADLLDIDNGQFSQGFLSSTKNLQLMRDAIDGDIDAYNELRELAQQDMESILHISADDTDFWNAKSEVEAAMNEMDFQNIEIGASLEADGFYSQLENMINAAGMTKDQATQYLSQMGINAQVIETDTEAEQNSQALEYNSTLTPNTQTVTDKVLTNDGSQLSEKQVEQSVTSWDQTVEATPVPATAKKQNKAFSLKVVSANKSSGGGFKFKQASNGGGSKGQSRRSSPSKKTGGGSRGSKPKKGSGSNKKKGKTEQPDTRQKDLKKALEDERDIYHDINIQIEQINRNLDRTQKKQDRLYGKQLLNNLTQQQKLLQKQREILLRKQKLQEQDLVSQQRVLQNLGVTFDAYGNISNYMSILGQKQDQINAKTAQYNNLVNQYNKSTKKEDKEKLEQSMDAIEKELELLQDQKKSTEDKIKDYDALREQMEDLKDDVEDSLQQEVEIQIKKFRMKVEIRLEMGQAERDWNKFQRQVLERPDYMKSVDFDSILADATQNKRDISSYFKVGNDIGSIQTLTNQLLDTKAAIDQIDKSGTSAIYGDNKALAMEHLQGDLEQLMKQLEDVESLIDDIDKAYLDTIDDIQKNFDNQIKDYEFIGDLIDHDIDLLTILYGDKNYDAMDKYYATLEQNNNKTLDSLRKQRDFWKQQWDSAAASGNTKAAEKFKENYMDAVKSLNSKIEESAKVLQQKYENAINKIFDTLDKKISNGKGTDYLSMEWQLMNKNADEYLDTINSAFAIQETQRKYQKALDETKSIKNQQSLKNLMDQQIDILKNKNKLTQYDIDRAEKLLQIEQARIAMEEARSAKTSMRLKRDSQGNYSYEYVADNAAVDDAAANLASAQNDLYNFDKERYKQNLEDMLSAWKDFQDKYKEIVLDTSLKQEERVAALALLREQYGEYINDKTEENLHIRGNLTESAFSDIAQIYNTDVSNYQQMASDEINILMTQLVPMWNSGIQQMSDKVAGERGFIPTCQKAFNDITIATENYKRKLDTMADTAGIDFNKVKNGIDSAASSFRGLVIENDNLISRMNTELNQINNLRDQVKGLAVDYQSVITAAKGAVSIIQEYTQSQKDAAAAEAARNKAAQTNTGKTGNNNTTPTTTKKTGDTVEIIYTTNKTKNSNTGSSPSNNNRGSSVQGSGGSGNKGTSTTPTKNQLIKNSNTSPILSNASAWLKKHTKRYATGGYTGDWNSDEGRLAILDQKELVLNKTDTENFLSGVAILRELNNSLKGNMFSMLNGLSTYNNQSSIGETIEQNVHIDASFPNVNSKKEIEEAFSELVNMAAQRVMRK